MLVVNGCWGNFDEYMIPKIIHYCWFGGGKMPSMEVRCMKSWADKLPDYKVMRWDESTFDVNSTPFTAAAYKAKKYAFVADYVRLYALLKYGGIYLDTDIEIVKPFDDLLHYSAFGGFETSEVMQTGVLGVSSANEVMQEFFEVYHHIPYEVDKQGNNLTPANSAILAKILVSHGLKLDNSRQSIGGMEIFPQDYFCPINQATRQIICTENTYTIHYLHGSWFSPKLRMINATKRFVGKYLGYGVVNFVRRIVKP